MRKPTIRILIALCMSFIAGLWSHASAASRMYGTVNRTVDSPAWYTGMGWYEIFADADTPFARITSADVAIQSDWGALKVGKTLYSFFKVSAGPYYTAYMMRAYDIETSQQLTNVSQDDIGLTKMATSLVYDEKTGKTYGCFFTNNSGAGEFSFGTADYVENPAEQYWKPTVTSIAPCTRWSVIVMDKSGQIYAIDATTGMLLKVNKETGATTEVGNTGLITSLQCAGAIDPATGVMYYSFSKSWNEISMYTIDLSTGAATLVADRADHPMVTYMYIQPDETDPEPTDMPSDFYALVNRTVNSPSWYKNAGWYQIYPDADSPFTKITSEDDYIQSDWGGLKVGNTIYSFFKVSAGPYYTAYMMRANDINTSATITNVSQDDIGLTKMATSLVYDEKTGKTYGCFFTNNSGAGEFSFGTADYVENPAEQYWKPTVTSIAPCTRWSVITMDKDGQIYAIDATTGMLLKVDKETGATTEIGNTGLATSLQCAGAIDPATGVMYYSFSKSWDEISMYTIDLATGAATLVADRPDHPMMTYMYIKSNQADPEPELPESDFYAAVYRTNPTADWFGSMGYYKMTTDASDPFIQVTSKDVAMQNDWGALQVGKTLYSFFKVSMGPYYTAYMMRAYDIETSEMVTNVSQDDIGLTKMATSLVYDEKSGKTYGCFFTNNSGAGEFSFGTADYVENPAEQYWKPTVTSIAPCTRWSVITMDKDGQIYAIDANTGMLLKVDKETGATTEIGNTGLATIIPCGGAIDPATGVMYYSFNKSYFETSLYTIDLTTGSATLIADREDNPVITYMNIKDNAPVEVGAPSAATNLAASFPEGALTGEFTFDVPATSEGQLSYKLSLGEELEFNGTTSFGASVKVPVTVPQRGLYTAVVTLSNQAGEAVSSPLEVFIGKGMPAAPQNVKAEIEGKNVNISWDAVTEPIDGGYMNAVNIRYTVYRLSDNNEVMIGEAIQNNTLTDNTDAFDDFVNYSYAVSAFSIDDDTLVSEFGVSGNVNLGLPIPPYSQDFSNENEVNTDMTVIDANNDGFKWQYFRGRMMMRITGFDPHPMDDWLLTPGLRMRKGNLYPFTIEMEGGVGYTEIFEVKAGMEKSAEGMTLTVIEPTGLGTDAKTYRGYIIPNETGVYHVGVHAMSGESCFQMFADNLNIGEASTAAVPARVDNLTATNDYNGKSECTLTFTLPTLTAEGNSVGEITAVTILRDDEQIYSGVPESNDVTYVDAAETGYHEYTVYAVNEAGNGIERVIRSFVGVGIPNRPGNPEIVETSTPGQVLVTWEEVTTDWDGNDLNPELVTYSLVDTGTGEVVKSDLRVCNATMLVADEGEQVWAEYAIYAHTTAGRSPVSALTRMIPAGDAYTTPWRESFANGRVEKIWARYLISSGGDWVFNTDCDMTEVNAWDGDNGYAVMTGEFSGAEAGLRSGKIDLTNVENPLLTFRLYNFAQKTSTNSVKVMVSTDQSATYQNAGEVVVADTGTGATGSWLKASIDLSPWKGQIVILEFIAHNDNWNMTLVDDICIGEKLDNNLRATSIEGPAIVDMNVPYDVTVTVENTGNLKADNWTVVLYDGDEKVAESEAGELAADGVKTIRFNRAFTPTSAQEANYTAKVVYEADAREDDNMTAAVSTICRDNYLPKVDNLAWNTDANCMILTWDEPDTDTALPEITTDDFESYNGFMTENVGDWRFYDLDGEVIGGLGYGKDIPGIPDYQGPASFFTLDVTGGENGPLGAHSGVKYVAQMYRNDYGQVDDWLVSPELCGAAQTVSFYAKSYHATKAENIEVLASSTGNEPEDFELIAEFQRLTTKWTEYHVALPEGTKYFAIRDITTDGFMLMVDDVTFVPEGAAQTLDIIGYNVYRNGEKLNDQPVESTSYPVMISDENVGKVFAVTCVYDKGESQASESLLMESGVNGAYAATFKAKAGRNVITVSGAENGIYIYNAAGMTIYNGDAYEDVNVDAVPGVYVVTDGQRRVKLIVK